MQHGLPETLQGKVKFLSSSLITKQVKNEEDSIGLIPTLDLIKNNDLFVSKSFGISFEGALSNSYLYFHPNQQKLNEINLLGDVSSVEVILTKIFFKESYNTDVGVNLVTDESKLDNKNLLAVGDINLTQDRHFSGVSFADEFTEVLLLPYVNYILVANNQSLLNEFSNVVRDLTGNIYRVLDEENFPFNLTERTSNYIRDNIASVIFEFNEQDVDGIDQLIRLPYFHGIIDDIAEVKYV